MKIIKIIKIKTRRYKLKKIYLFGIIPLFQYKIIYWKKTLKSFSLLKKYSPAKNQRVFYLKTHRLHKMSTDCIQHWVNIAHKMNAFIYIVCDNPKMQKEISYNVIFWNDNVEFIKSDKKSMKKYINTILKSVSRSELWQRIAFSMMTPFTHAAKNNYELSYNIDADDIMILANPELISKALIKAENYSQEKNLDLFNLDMFFSKTFGVHWSFGVVICRNPQRCIEVVMKNTDWRWNLNLIKKFNICWIDKYNFNVDWLFTYIRDTNQLNMGTFYIDNSHVVHMPDRILEHGWAFMLHWKDNKINFPILSNLYLHNCWETMLIPKECLKIDIGINDNEYKHFINSFYDNDFCLEFDMLNYAVARNLVNSNIYTSYAKSEEFIKKNQRREKCWENL